MIAEISESPRTMADFPRKQVLPDKFYDLNGPKLWHKVPAVPFYSLYPDLLERNAARADVSYFIRDETKGRFYVDRTSQPGYYFEDPRDAMLYKLKYL